MSRTLGPPIAIVFFIADGQSVAPMLAAMATTASRAGSASASHAALPSPAANARA